MKIPNNEDVVEEKVDVKEREYRKTSYSKNLLSCITKVLSNIIQDNKFKIKKNIKDLITFRELNLMNNFPFSGKFDVIFCRNVVIYFDEETEFYGSSIPTGSTVH